MSTSYIPVDDDDEAPETWVESNWIRPDNPLAYPGDNVPPVVSRQRELLLQLPPASDDLLPHDFVPILSLLQPASGHVTPLQEIAPAPVHFSRAIPNPNPHAIVKALKSRTSMPPMLIVRQLENELNQAWFDGNVSIIDKHYADYPLPFWVIPLWKQLDFVHRQRMKWRCVEERIRSARSRDRQIHIELRRVADAVMDCLRVVGWHAPLAGFPSTGWRGELERVAQSFDAPIGWTTSFIQFFEDSFLDDEAMNMMLHWIHLQVQRDATLSKSTIVVDLTFTQALLEYHSLAETPTRKCFTRLTDVEDLVKHLHRKVLYFVVNPGQAHWAVVKVDFQQRTRAYGDSLAGTFRQDKAAINALDYWLSSSFPDPGRPFVVAPNVPCERQLDGTSCGIATCSTISNQLGLQSPWSAKNATLSRYTWGLRLMQIHQDASTNGYSTAHDIEGIQEPVISDSPTTLATITATNQRVNRMDINMLVHTCDPDDTTSATLEHTCESSDSDSPVLLASKEHLASDSSLPYDSPSPLDTNNQYHRGYLSPGQNRTDYVEREGVLHFVDSSDDEFVPGSGAQPLEISFSTNNLGKHPRSPSISESSDVDLPMQQLVLKSDISSRKHRPFTKQADEQHAGPTGISKTARADRKKLDSIAAGTFIINRVDAQALLHRARKIDPGAKLDPNDAYGQSLIHSVCGKPIALDGPLRTSKFQRHHGTCQSNNGLRKNAGKSAKAAQGCKKIDTFFKKVDPNQPSTNSSSRSHTLPSKSTSFSSSAPLPSKMVQCRGLRLEHNAKIRPVLERSSQGGTLSIQKIAFNDFNKAYKELTDEEKQSVRNAVTSTAEWQVHLDPIPHVRHTDCRKKCDPTESGVIPADVCESCLGLLRAKSFQRAMNRKLVEDPSNYKFVPYASRNKSQALLYAKYVGLEDLIKQSDSNSNTPLMQFVHSALNGTIKNSQVFSGLVQAIAAREDKLVRGKGMQGIRYPPGWVDFCNVTYSTSPRAYKLLQKYGFPVLGERDLRKRRSQTLGFPAGICDKTFQRAAHFLSTIGYTGPVSISCDDTQLLSKWSPYYDGTCQKWFVLGGIGEPIEVDGDAEDVQDLLVKATDGKEKATKLRLWCLQATAPKIPVFILAAMAISSSLKADHLYEYHDKLIGGLLDAGACLTSYACDGSATERKVVQLFAQSAIASEEFIIHHPEPGFNPHIIPLRFYGPNRTPIISIQDSKHAAKTYRNVLCSGARCLILGNSVAHYLQLLALSKHPRSPLYRRDVLKIDRQDDRAALRVFSSAMVNLILELMNDQESASKIDPTLGKDLTGLVTYLFVFGDLIDAFQSRCLTNTERCKMVLRAHYFLEIWRSSLRALNYPEDTHCISREAQQITRSLIDGFIGLVLVHRDHLDQDNYPFTPWLHSTESCEHTFGEARKNKPDFTFSDFLQMQPKLRVLFDAAVLNGEYESDSNARAAGYYHTEYSAKGINIPALSVQPTDSMISEAARLAFYEAKALFDLCGIPVTNTLYSPTQSNESSILPIDQWLYAEDNMNDWDHTGVDGTSTACEFTEQPVGAAVELQRILEAEGTRPLGPIEFEDKMDVYAFAAVALELEGQNEIDRMPNCDHESDWRAIRDELTLEFPNFPLPPLVIAEEVRQALCRLDPSEIDISMLATIRAAHETNFAKKAIRTGAIGKECSTTTVSNDTDPPETSHLARQKMVKKLHEALRSLDDTVGSSTGAARRLHHQGEVSVAPTGNAANAAVVANQRSDAAMRTRVEKLKKAKVECVELVGHAGVSRIAPVRTGAFAIVSVEERLWLAEVITMYSKSAGKGGTHSWIESATSISSLSYIVVQLWENWNGKSEFRSIVKATASHHAYRFAHIPWQRLLYVALPSSIQRPSPDRIHVQDSLYKVWSIISREEQIIGSVMKDLLRRSRNTGLEENPE